MLPFALPDVPYLIRVRHLEEVSGPLGRLPILLPGWTTEGGTPPGGMHDKGGPS